MRRLNLTRVLIATARAVQEPKAAAKAAGLSLKSEIEVLSMKPLTA